MDATLYALLDSGTTVLTASRRLAHWLRTSFAAHAQLSGRTVWPTPQVLPWATFLRDAVREQRNQQPDAPRLLTELQALALWERIVGDSVSGQQLLNPTQAARSAATSWQRLHEYRVPLTAVAAYPTEEAQALASWAQNFRQYTAQHNWLDGARFATWLADTGYVPAGSLALAGFDQLTPEMQLLISRWQDLGVDVTRLAPPANAATVQVIAAKQSAAELELAARWARLQVEHGKRRIAVVVPQLTTRAAEVQRVFMKVFNPAAGRSGTDAAANAFVVAASPLLSAYPLVHHALLCLQLAQGKADTLLMGQLLRSPFLLGYETEAAARAVADIAAREQRREQWDLSESQRFAAANACPVLAAAMFSASQALREQRGTALPSQWTERFSKLLQQMGWPHGHSLTSDAQQTRAKFHELLAELSALDELLGRVSFNQALAILRDACNAASFAPESSDQPVMIIDADTVAGMEFDAVWVMGLHAGEWPAAIDPDPFLPIEVQRQYGLPHATAVQCLQTAQRKLQRLVQSAHAVVLSWPQRDGDAELRASPLLGAWPDVALADLACSSVQSAAQQLFAQRPLLETFVDNRAPALAAAQVRGGSLVFELQSRCAFRAQAQLRLHAAAVPSVSLAIDPTERGILIHRVLGEVWQELKSSAGLKAAFGVSAPALESSEQSPLPQAGEGKEMISSDAINTLTQHIRNTTSRIAQHVMPTTTIHRQRLVALEVELATQWIMALLQVELQRAPFMVRRAEERELFKFAELNIAIQLDRIDELADGSTVLIDYKTGDANQVSDWLDVAYPGRPRRAQLPLYALAHRERLAGITFAVLAPGKAEFRGLARTAEIAVGIRDYASCKPNAKPANAETWDDLLAHWDAVLQGLGKQFLAGEAAVDPLRDECNYCHLAGLCRVTELNGVRDSAVEEGGDD